MLVLPPTLPVSKINTSNGLGWLLQWVKKLLHGPELMTVRRRSPELQEPNLSISTGSQPKDLYKFVSQLNISCLLGRESYFPLPSFKLSLGRTSRGSILNRWELRESFKVNK